MSTTSPQASPQQNAQTKPAPAGPTNEAAQPNDAPKSPSPLQKGKIILTKQTQRRLNHRNCSRRRIHRRLRQRWSPRRPSLSLLPNSRSNLPRQRPASPNLIRWRNLMRTLTMATTRRTRSTSERRSLPRTRRR